MMNQPGGINSNTRSPFEYLFNMFPFGGIPKGHEKPLKHAFYNAAALFLLFVLSVAAYGLFLILQPFFKPLLWALLVGSVLYPLKRELSEQIKIWLSTLDESNTSIIMGVIKLPANVIDRLSELLGRWLFQHAKIIISLMTILLTMQFLHCYIPSSFTCIIWKIMLLSNVIFTWIISLFETKIVLSSTCCYVVMLFCFWSPDRATLFKHTSIIMWFIISCYTSNILGVFQVPLFFIIQISVISGWILKKHNQNSNYQYSNESQDTADNQKKILLSVNDAQKEINTEGDAPPKAQIIEQEKNVQVSSKFKRLSIVKNPLCFQQCNNVNNDYVLDSDIYFNFLFYSCGFLLLWKQLWLLPLLTIPVIVFLSKRLWYFFGMHSKVCSYIQHLLNRFEERKHSLISVPVEGAIVLIQYIHRVLLNTAKESVDSVSSGAVILVLLISLSIAMLFISIQIYAEVIQMVQMGSSFVNKTIIHNPELLGLLPPEVEESFDNLLENAYQYGRDGISKLVKCFLQDVDSTQAQHLESQLLTLWDRAYQSWIDNPNTVSHGPHVSQDAVRQSFDTFMEDLYKSSELLNVAGIMNWMKQNIGTLTGVLESTWSLLRGNLELLLGIITAAVHLLLGSSSAVITWLLNSMVFLTTLFYLLASSGKQYRPVEVLSKLAGGAKTVKRVSIALEETVAGVFLATLKMSLFYGLWTWLIHNIFGTSVIYLPAVIASALAAVPFLGTYWVCSVGVLELLCLQDRFWSAIGLAVFQVAPTTLVDGTIYNEIKGGGHPYLTGLSIAGGLWCLGPEGTLLGPLLLCLLVVVTDLFTAAIRDSPIAEPHSEKNPGL